MPLNDLTGADDLKAIEALTGTSGTLTKTAANTWALSSGVTPASHTHGNIQNGGTLQSSDITIASGDKLVVTDSSDSNKVARTSISFDGSTATKALTQKGTWETFNNYSHPTGAGNNHIPTGGSSGQYLKYSSSGTATWASLPTASTTGAGIIQIGTGATNAAAGNHTHSTYMVKGTDYVTAGQLSGSTLGTRATAEGYLTIASGNYSHAEGSGAATGNYSHAEGSETVATGLDSHAEGSGTEASNGNSHAEGCGARATGDSSHAEGFGTTASGTYSHAENYSTVASGNYSHSEGQFVTASGVNSHAEGFETTASGENSHAEGHYTVASGEGSHAEGAIEEYLIKISTTASSNNLHYDINPEYMQPYIRILDFVSFSPNDINIKFIYDYNEFTPSNIDIIDGYITGFIVDTPLSNSTLNNADATVLIYNEAKGKGSHVEGEETLAISENTHAEGFGSTANGSCSHAEGVQTIAYGYSSHSEGLNTLASGEYSHAEGANTTASNGDSHAEGSGTTASGASSHAEGYYTTASVRYSHAEGYRTTTTGNQSHAEGYYTTASGASSHAEGQYTKTSKDYSHAEGSYTIASGSGSHAEGNSTIYNSSSIVMSGDANATTYNVSGSVYIGRYQHNTVVRPNLTFIYNSYSFTPTSITTNNTGYLTSFTVDTTLSSSAISNKRIVVRYPSVAQGSGSHAEGNGTIAYGDFSHAEGKSTLAYNSTSHAEGLRTTASGSSGSHAEGQDTTASGTSSHAEGYWTTASNTYSHAEGQFVTASGVNSHAEGFETTASGDGSHAEGGNTIASGDQSHAEGGQITVNSVTTNTTASGDYSHAEGRGTLSQGTGTHTEGILTKVSNYTQAGHAEGYQTEVRGHYGHAEGLGTVSKGTSQHVFGEYNIIDPHSGTYQQRHKYVEIVGNGTSSARSNARTLDWSGNETLAGKLTVGTGPTANMDVATKKYVDDAIAAAIASLS